MSKLWTKLDRASPRLCRLLARKKHGLLPMSNADIALRSGLARSTVNKIGQMQNWDRVTVGVMKRFMAGCGVDPWLLYKQFNYWRRLGLKYLRQSNNMQRRMYDRLLSELTGTAKDG